jgi:hypothetical protein
MSATMLALMSLPSSKPQGRFTESPVMDAMRWYVISLSDRVCRRLGLCFQQKRPNPRKGCLDLR